MEKSGLEEMGATAEVSVNLVVVFFKASLPERPCSTFNIFDKIQAKESSLGVCSLFG